MSIVAPASLARASKAPWWLLACFLVSTFVTLAWAAAWTLGVIYADYTSHPAENAMLIPGRSLDATHNASRFAIVPELVRCPR